MAKTQTTTVPSVSEESAEGTTTPTIHGLSEENVEMSKENNIPTPTVFSLSEEVTEQFAQNGIYDMVFAMKMDGSFDVYVKRVKNKENPGQYLPQSIARMNMQDKSKQLYEVFTGDFQPLIPKSPARNEDPTAFANEKLAEADLILKNRFTHTTIPIAWSTIAPIPGVPHSNCGTASAFGYCWVTP